MGSRDLAIYTCIANSGVTYGSCVMLSYRLTGLVFFFQPVFVDRGAGLNGSTYWWFATSVVQVLDTSLAELEQQQRVEYALFFLK